MDQFLGLLWVASVAAATEVGRRCGRLVWKFHRRGRTPPPPDPDETSTLTDAEQNVLDMAADFRKAREAEEE